MKRQIHEKIKVFIKEHQLIKKGDELVLGVSGGADSMMMLYYFFTYQKEYHISLKVAHVHHGLRESAEKDAKLVEQVCKDYQIPFFRHDCNIKKIAKEKKISEEEAGRQERYNFFISLLNKNGKIATAHNMNDQAETMLMRFIRGTDLKGLAGISPKREQIIRPLLCLTRKEIEGYCEDEHIPFRHDETNFKPIYTRNKIRLKCIPYIKETFNPNIIQCLGIHSEMYREENDFLEGYGEECFLAVSSLSEDKIILDKKLLESYHSYIQKKVFLIAIERLIGKKDITTKHIESCFKLLNLQTGKQVQLPQGLIVRREYEQIILERYKLQTGYCYDLIMGENRLDDIKMKVRLNKLPIEVYRNLQTIQQKNENNYTKYVDYGRIKSGLQIRTREVLDFIQLKNGTKKLKKLFVDDKIPKTLRDDIPLIAQGNEIIWVFGNRLNVAYYITEQTKEVLEIEILKEYE